MRGRLIRLDIINFTRVTIDVNLPPPSLLAWHVADISIQYELTAILPAMLPHGNQFSGK